MKLTARTLASRGWQVEIVSMLDPPTFIPELNGSGIPVHSLGLKRGKPNPIGLVRLIVHMRRFRPHVLHCHMVHANLLGRIARLFGPARVVVSTAHSTWEGPHWRDWAYWATDKLADVTSNVSHAGLRRYIQDGLVAPDKGIWLPNGVDTSDFAPRRFDREALRRDYGWTEHFVWVAVGNLREPKDYPNLLNAFRPLALASRRPLLAIAGCGPLERELNSLAADLGISQSVRFLGSRPDVPQLLAAADGYVMSSAWEGTPMAVLEAAASALPIVATRVGGNPEAIEHGTSGKLVPPKDSEKLSQAMSEVMAMSAQSRQTMGCAARRRVEALYRLERVVDKWENIYEQLLQVRDGGKRRSEPHDTLLARLRCNWR
ncbi:MAG: glycosyltransferase [Bryobacterales bacterium]|nr:glycosyltransferase [Bryobacterales bacterium]